MRPRTTFSGIAPAGKAMTGVPPAAASIVTRALVSGASAGRRARPDQPVRNGAATLRTVRVSRAAKLSCWRNGDDRCGSLSRVSPAMREICNDFRGERCRARQWLTPGAARQGARDRRCGYVRRRGRVNHDGAARETGADRPIRRLAAHALISQPDRPGFSA